MADENYVLSRRAADALRPLLRAGTSLDSRQRQIRDPRGGGQPEPIFLECRIFHVADETTGEDTPELRVYIGPAGNYPPSLRVNGRVAPLGIQTTDVDEAGWLTLGSAESIVAVWLVPQALPFQSPQTYRNATNRGAGQIVYAFDTTGSGLAPGVSPQNVPDGNWTRWLRPLMVALVSPTAVRQGIFGGAEITVEVGDADGTHSGGTTPGPGVAGGFCSVQQTELAELQLFEFTTGERPDPTNVSLGDYDFVLRQCDGHGPGASPSYAALRYMSVERLLDYLSTKYTADLEAWLRAHPDLVADILRDFDEDNAGPFWLSGGTSDTCFGNLIGNVAGTDVIDLANLQLIGGMWRTGDGVNFETGSNQRPGNLTVHGQASVNGQLVTNSSATIGGSLDITGASLDATAATAKFQEVQTTSLRVGGDNYVPTQIVLANGQTLTVLAKQ